jgi:hypothetical protein
VTVLDQRGGLVDRPVNVRTAAANGGDDRRAGRDPVTRLAVDKHCGQREPPSRKGIKIVTDVTNVGARCGFFERQYFELPNQDRILQAADQVRVHQAMLKQVVRSLGELGITTRKKASETKTLKLIEEPLWKISEAFGKYKTRYFSEKAVQSVVDRFGKRRSAGLQHDHVVPRKRLVDMLFENAGTLDRVIGLCVGCVVVETEHPSLTAHEKDIDLDDVWAKYRDADIRVVDCKTGEFVNFALPCTKIEGWAQFRE